MRISCPLLKQTSKICILYSNEQIKTIHTSNLSLNLLVIDLPYKNMFNV